jgi:HSP20 family protein
MLRFDPFFDFDRVAQPVARQRSMLALDAVRDDDEVTIYLDVPGVTGDDLDVSVERHELTVRVERRWRDDDKRTIARERSQGAFERQLTLSDALDTDRLTAELAEGVLIIKVPVAERAKQRSIEVSGTDGRAEPIETGAAG